MLGPEDVPLKLETQVEPTIATSAVNTKAVPNSVSLVEFFSGTARSTAWRGCVDNIWGDGAHEVEGLGVGAPDTEPDPEGNDDW